MIVHAPEQLSIRPAVEADLEAIWCIETAEFGNDAWSIEVMREELTAPHRQYLALVDEVDAVRGYAGLLSVGMDGDIQTIAVAPEVRGQGYGRRLMEELLHTADDLGVERVFLEVRADKPVARGLYESLGFEQIDVRRGYYQPDGIDAIVMKREPKP